MPLRSPKMYSFIFGFHRRTWWPKCTPASSNSFIVTETKLNLLLVNWFNVLAAAPWTSFEATNSSCDNGLDYWRLPISDCRIFVFHTARYKKPIGNRQSPIGNVVTVSRTGSACGRLFVRTSFAL